MPLFHKKLLTQQLARYTFPSGQELENIYTILTGWQKALKDSNLDRTKETGIQGQFLTKFFEAILGYSTQTSGKELWHLNQEPKTEVDAQEADGSLGFFSKDSSRTLAVIELKDAKTSLDKKQAGRIGKLTPVEQAFQYLNKFDGCKWVIVSNFREIRLYSKARGQGFYEKFDIIGLSDEAEFKRFYYILNQVNLIGREQGQTSVIDTLVANTSAQEEDITKKFYSEYKDIRLQLIQHLIANNPSADKLILIEKAQKLLDRLIFTMVCEDSSSLLPANIVKNTYERSFQSFALSGNDQRVWLNFKGLFHAIDQGAKDIDPPINAYNGGLFRADDSLDNLVVKDEIWKELLRLTNYDFESELNVNVLGHIFEQSISDLEELKASVEGEITDKKKSLRKKQGIFYTPEYITKFIVENTVGKYLEENPDQLASIKILDPACGSGAFLNQAHSFLLNQYKIRDEEKQLALQKKGKATSFFDQSWVENDKSILLNNLFGVDLSPESVEITKLGLWLKTAKATESLQNLDGNIKCGNSLIDDPAIAGERAFNWQSEYTEVMKNGGFDVVVGNPPYGADIDVLYEWFEKNYPNTSSGHKDTYKFFIDKNLSLLKTNGYLGFIVPNTFIFQPKYKDLKELIDQYEHFIINLGDKIFEDAEVPVCMLIIKKTKNNGSLFVDISNEKSGNHEAKLTNFDIESERNKQKSTEEIFSKSSLKLEDVLEIKDGGIKYQRSDIGLSNKGGNDLYERLFQKDSALANYTNTWYGSLIDRYYMNPSTDESFNLNYKSILNKNEIVFFSEKLFDKEIKILWRQTASYVQAVIDDKKRWFRNTIQGAYLKEEYQSLDLYFVLAVMNSKLFKFFYTSKIKEQGRVFPQVKLTYLKPLPFALGSKDQQNQLGKLAREITAEVAKLKQLAKDQIEFLSGKHNLTRNKRLNDFANIGWNELSDELVKQKIKLPMKENEELFSWFKKKQQTNKNIADKIKKIDNEIDELVYELYGLTQDEVDVVKNY